MSIIIRSIRNVLRNPVRLILVVLLLGVSLMFVAAMVSLNTSAQQQLTNVHKDLGTGITINYATNEAASSSSGSGGFGGFGGGGGGFGGTQTDTTTTPIPDSTVTKIAAVPGVDGVEENLRRQDTDDILKTSSFTTPQGKAITIPPTVNGISNGATHFTLGTGSAPTVVSGRNFESSDANADVAMLSQSLAQTNNLTVGSTFKLKGTTFTIIGLYTTGTTGTTSRFADDSIIIPMATMEKLYAVAGVDSITAYAATYDQVSTVSAAISKALGAQYDVVTQQTFVQNAIAAIDESQNSIQLAMIVSIITAAVVIIFAVILLVRERTTEIGTLKALGASHWQVIRQFWSEVFTLSLLAAAMAVVLLVTVGPTVIRQFSSSTRGGGGGFAGRAAGGFGGGGGGFGGAGALFGGGTSTNLSAAILTPQSLLIILGLGIGLALLTSVIPAWYVAHIRPAEVLRKGN